MIIYNLALIMRPLTIYYITILILLLTGCSGDMQQEPPVTPSEVLNELVRSAPWLYIDLDQAELLEIELTPDDIIYDTHREVEDGEPFLGQITRFTYTDGYLYVYDSTGSAIYLIDPEGNPDGPFTREGRGPGEHVFVRDRRSFIDYQK